LWHPSAI